MDINFKDILKKHKDPDYIVSCLNILTPIEKSIILILHTKKTALNIKQIQDEFVLNIIITIQWWFQQGSGLGDAIQEHWESKIKLLPCFDFTPDDFATIQHEIFEIKSKEKEESFLDVLDSSQKSVDGYKKLLLKLGISHPSFEKIDADLNTLTKMNLIVKRDPADKKSKGLWALNPEIDYFLNKTKIDIYKIKFPSRSSKS